MQLITSKWQNKQCQDIASRRITCLFLITLFLGGYLHYAKADEELPGLHFSVTRLVYPSTARNGVPVVFTNNGPTNHLIQAYMSQLDPNTGLSGPRTTDFTVLPPVSMLSAGASTTLRVLRVGGDLPADRESVGFLVMRLIPAGSLPPVGKGALASKVIQELAIKVFYRPAGLPEGGVSEAMKKVTVRLQGGKVTFMNPTPFWLTPGVISVDGAPLPAGSLFLMVPPKGEQSWPLPKGVKAKGGESTVTWSVVTERGIASPTVTLPLQAGGQ